MERLLGVVMASFNRPIHVPTSWFRPDPFPELGRYGVTGNTLSRMEMELASSDVSQRELHFSDEQKEQIAQVNVAAIPFNASVV